MNYGLDLSKYFCIWSQYEWIIETSVYLCVLNCVFLFVFNFNHLKIGQFWQFLIYYLYVNCLNCHLGYLCSFNNNTNQTLFPCNLNAVCIWLGTKCDEWGYVQLNEWMNGLPTVFFYVMNVTSECLNELSTVFHVMNVTLYEWALFQETLSQLGKNVMYKWYEWLCDWDWFIQCISTV